MAQVQAAELVCPHCGATEVTAETKGLPLLEQRVNIRAYKVYSGGRWQSHCIPCDKWF